MKAAFFDVDGTLTQTRVWDGITEYFEQAGKKRLTNFVFFAYHGSLYFLFKMKLISTTQLREPWAKHLSWYFKGYSESEMDTAWNWIVNEYMDGRWREDVIRKLEEHKANGDIVFIVSGGPEPMLAHIAQKVGADHAVGTRHEVKNSVFTGRADGEACQGERKVSFTKQRIADLALDIDLSASYTYADSPGDLNLLEMVGNPVPTYPDKRLEPIVRERGWQIFPEER